MIATAQRLTPSAPVFDESDGLDALGAGLRGRLILPSHRDYDAARRVVNFAFDRRPRAIVRAADAQDVAAAVSYAREYAQPLAVRSGWAYSRA